MSGKTIMTRKPHTLAPQRWRLVAIITDTPGPGEGHISREEIEEQLLQAMDLPAGLTFEVGTIEMAAKGGG